MSEYGKAPEALGTWDLEWHEVMRYLYLPVVMPEQDGLRLPRRLAFLGPMLSYIVGAERPAGYVYVSAHRGHATPSDPLNRPGWHADGFGTSDINYVWADRFPTRFAVQPFEGIPVGHAESIAEFERQLDPSRIVTYPDRTLLCIDPYVVHATPEVPEGGGERGFIKVSVSSQRYNLRGNSHNHLFDYDWPMWTREQVRNSPAYASKPHIARGPLGWWRSAVRGQVDRNRAARLWCEARNRSA